MAATSLAYDERLDHLLAVAARVFAQKGYHATTMRDLARASGMSLAGMYYYVRGKNELLYLIQERCFREVIDGAERSIGEAATPLERVERFIRHHVLFFARRMDAMKVLSHEANSLKGKHLERIKALKRRYVKMLAELLAELDAECGDPLDPQLSAYALFGMMNWIYTWYNPRGPVSPRALAEHFSRLFLYGARGAPVPMPEEQPYR
ncbi:HTH-type transcriptional repressor KstR2 [bacterium HR33]|nr:HTH-type transcriptional repressor KstR2 [bacterium HR33]